jgi:hypothetical protein
MVKALGGHIPVPGEPPIVVSCNLENGRREADLVPYPAYTCFDGKRAMRFCPAPSTYLAFLVR